MKPKYLGAVCLRISDAYVITVKGWGAIYADNLNDALLFSMRLRAAGYTPRLKRNPDRRWIDAGD
jgi:hypothetical protein